MRGTGPLSDGAVLLLGAMTGEPPVLVGKNHVIACYLKYLMYSRNDTSKLKRSFSLRGSGQFPNPHSVKILTS